MAESQANVHALRHVYKGQYVKVYTDDVNFELGLVQDVSTSKASAPTSASHLVQQPYQHLLKPKQAPQAAAKPATADTIVTVKTLTGFQLTVPLAKLRRAFLVILDLNGVLGSRILTRPIQTHQSGVIQLTSELRGGQGQDKDGRPISIGTAEAVQVANVSAFVARPNLGEFLSFLFKNFIVGVWTSGEQRNATPIIDFLFGPDLNNGVDYRKRLLFSLFRSDTTSRPTPEKPFATIKDLDRAVFSTFVAEVPQDEEVMTTMGTPLSSSELFMTMSAGANLPVASKSGGGSQMVSLFHVGNTIIIDDSSDKCSHPDNALCPTTFGDSECERLVLRVRPPYTAGTSKAACLLLTPNGMTQNATVPVATVDTTEDGLLRTIKVLNEVIDQDTLAPLVPEAREALRAKDLAASAALLTAKQQQAEKVREELHRIMMSGSGSGTSNTTSKVNSPLQSVQATGPPGENSSAAKAIMSLLSKGPTSTTAPAKQPPTVANPSTAPAPVATDFNSKWNSPTTMPSTTVANSASSGQPQPPQINRSSDDSSDSDGDSDSEGPCFEDDSDDEGLGNSGIAGNNTNNEVGGPSQGKILSAKALKKKAKLKEKKQKKKALKAASVPTQQNAAATADKSPVFTAIAKRPKVPAQAPEGKNLPPPANAHPAGNTMPPPAGQPQTETAPAGRGYRGRGGRGGGRGRGGADGS